MPSSSSILKESPRWIVFITASRSKYRFSSGVKLFSEVYLIDESKYNLFLFVVIETLTFFGHSPLFFIIAIAFFLLLNHNCVSLSLVTTLFVLSCDFVAKNGIIVVCI